MGERKVTNKYYPPDFEPSTRRVKKPKNERQILVRMMVPMRIRCNTCGNYISEGTKVNSRKEDHVDGETYLGIKIFRFYFKCTNCSSEIVIKTDPQNSDYVVESGARRRLDSVTPLEEEEEEKRSLDYERERDVLAALEEMKSMNSRRANLTVDAMLEALKEKEKKSSEEKSVEDEELIKSIVFHNSKNYVRRIDDDDNVKRQKVSEVPPASNPTDYLTSTRLPVRASVIMKPVTASQSQVYMSTSSSVLQALCQNYSDSDEGEGEDEE